MAINNKLPFLEKICGSLDRDQLIFRGGLTLLILTELQAFQHLIIFHLSH
jgi:hypothetical protein